MVAMVNVMLWSKYDSQNMILFLKARVAKPNNQAVELQVGISVDS